MPDPDELAGWVDTLAGRDGVRAIRTGALFAAAAERFADAGFSVVDTLMLLRADLADPAVGPPRRPSTTRPPRCGHATTAWRRRSTAPRSEPSGATARPTSPRSGGPPRPIAPACAAPIVAAGAPRLLRRPPIVAFAITGAAGGQGYLQRLAVLPEHQRRGHGRALTVDSLAWMRRRRLSHAVVNTGIDNEPARALYESLGFRALPDRLVVMQLDLAPGR